MEASEERRKLLCQCGKPLGIFTAEGFELYCRFSRSGISNWTQRDWGATVRLFHLAAEVLRAIEAEAFVPNPGWQCKDCPFRGRCWAWK